MSFGTISPRMVVASVSASVRHSGPDAFVTVSPCCRIISTANASCFGTSACSRLSTASAASASFARSASGILSHVLREITVAPTTGASPMSSM